MTRSLAANFLLRRGNVWHFNMRVPPDLVSHFGTENWRYSLKTGCRKEAIKLARRHATAKDMQIEQARFARTGQDSLLLDQVVQFSSNVAAPIKPTNPDAMLSVVVKRVVAEKNLAQWSHKEYRICVRRFTDVVGDKDVRTINRSDVERFKTALTQMPTTGRSQVLKMCVQDQIDWAVENNAPRISSARVNTYIITLQSILTHAHDRTAIFDGVRGWVAPTKGFIDSTKKVKQISKEGGDRRPFSPQEIVSIFDPDGDFEVGFAKGMTTRRWMVHLMRWTGLRLDEAAQLRTVDIRRTDKGTHYLVVTNQAEGQKVKTNAALRHVPLHPDLIALGFQDFVNSIRQEHDEDTWLFRDFNHNDMKNRGSKVSSAFLRWVRKQSYITDGDRLGSHSLRHSFKTAGVGRIADVYLDAMCGHAPPDPATATYIKTIRFDADRLWEEGLSKMPL